MQPLKLILVAPNPALTHAFAEAFEGLPNVEIVHGLFQRLREFDCMVSAANSFGLMDGGVDAAITQFFGPQLMHSVQDRILGEFLGEQPVGTSIIVETDDPAHPFIAHTPTMRVPMDFGATDNVYTAMWAMLLAVYRHNQQNADKPICTVACPGLGTGAGNVPYHQAARQMALAYKNFLNPPRYISWPYADQRQLAVWLSNPPKAP